MKVVGRKRLEAFCARHADARPWIEAWLAELEATALATPAEVKTRYANASFLEGNTVVFNVKGNRYRLETTIAYRSGVMVINWIGTHGAYDRRNRSRNT
jgi:mRNA interferase HigB